MCIFQTFILFTDTTNKFDFFKGWALDIQRVLWMCVPPLFCACRAAERMQWLSHKITCYHQRGTGSWGDALATLWSTEFPHFAWVSRPFCLLLLDKPTEEQDAIPFLIVTVPALLVFPPPELMHEKSLASSYPWNNKCTWSLWVADQSKNWILKAEMWSEDSQPHQA